MRHDYSGIAMSYWSQVGRYWPSDNDIKAARGLELDFPSLRGVKPVKRKATATNYRYKKVAGFKPYSLARSARSEESHELPERKLARRQNPLYF